MINAEVGHASANSYVDVTYADAFFALSVKNTAWPTEASAKESALVEATQILDSQFMWNGDIASIEQALRWPRTGVYDADGRSLDGTIPKVVQDATCRLAYHLLESGGLDQSQNNLKGIKIGPIDIDFAEQQTTSAVPLVVVRSIRSVGSYQGSISGSISSVNAVRS